MKNSYKILRSSAAGDLEEQVNQLINGPSDQGTWCPLGGVSFVCIESKRDGYTELEFLFVQAMHKAHY